jgi:dTDP-glucose 4,6-dehydratase
MKILLTGGMGFMGSNMVRHLLNTYPDYHIVNVDKMTYAGNPENLRDVEDNDRYTFYKGDIADEARMDEIIGKEKPDVIVNYAAETHVDRSILDPKAFLMTDIIGTYSLLEAVRKHDIQKFVQISTDEVFGSIQEGAFTEDSPFEPNSPYSAAKAGGDHLCRAYNVTYQTPVIVTHSCNFMGPYQFPEKLIPLFITNLMEGKKVPVYGEGLNVREWIFTTDHCSAVDKIMHEGKIGEIYNIGTGNEMKNIDITKKILEHMDAGEEMMEFVQDRAGHDFRYAIDSTKLRNDLGWKPEVDFDEALERTIAWFKENESWWKPLKSGEYDEYYKKQYSQRS